MRRTLSRYPVPETKYFERVLRHDPNSLTQLIAATSASLPPVRDLAAQGLSLYAPWALLDAAWASLARGRDGRPSATNADLGQILDLFLALDDPVTQEPEGMERWEGYLQRTIHHQGPWQEDAYAQLSRSIALLDQTPYPDDADDPLEVILFPGLERALDLTNTGPLMLLTGYQTPASLRRTGKKRLETWLRNRKVLRPDRLAETALEAAGRQYTSLPGEQLTAQMVHALARKVMTLNQQVAELDKAIEARFREHRDFEVITSMPGLGVILGAEFLAATGGDMSFFGTPDRLAGFGGVAPVPRDSGKISGNLRRPRRYNRRLQRVFYTSALFSIRHCEDSRRFYDRKRSEGKRHIQAVLALARRRVNVLWALLRDRRTYQAVPPTAPSA
ncbi:transposase [Streptomyces geranii]|uniref:transposase n=1 Tax=Streptomyces geranii TaxID=2058923 RepID=UPI002FCD9A0F